MSNVTATSTHAAGTLGGAEPLSGTSFSRGHGRDTDGSGRQ